MTEDHGLLSDVGLNSTRRRVLLASLLSVLPLGLSGGRAEAINSSETQVTVPDQVKNGLPGPPGRRTALKWRRFSADWTSRGNTSC
jgi:hypothetical protein